MVIDADTNVPRKKIIFHIGIQQNGLILLYLLTIQEHATIIEKSLKAENQKEIVSSIIKTKLTVLVQIIWAMLSGPYSEPHNILVIFYASNISFWTSKGQKIKMHATHARNADECVAKNGEWLEFYDYLDIVENAMNEAQCLGGKGARAAKRAGRSEKDLVWGYPRLVYIYVSKLFYTNDFRQVGGERHQIPEKKCLGEY